MCESLQFQKSMVTILMSLVQGNPLSQVSSRHGNIICFSEPVQSSLDTVGTTLEEGN